MSPAFETPRLRVIAATPDMARAAVTDRTRLGVLLDARVPNAWPAKDMADVEAMFADTLDADPALTGWWHWYVVLKARQPTLIGSVGFAGRPDADGQVTAGYGVLPDYEGNGFASEAFAGLLNWARGTGQVRRVVATTFEGHAPSVRILTKSGFVCEGVSPHDAAAPESDRQGRGRLMVYARTLSPAQSA